MPVCNCLCICNSFRLTIEQCSLRFFKLWLIRWHMNTTSVLRLFSAQQKRSKTKRNTYFIDQNAIIDVMFNCFFSSYVTELFCYKQPGSQVALMVLWVPQKNISYVGITEMPETFNIVASSVQVVFFYFASNLRGIKLLQNYHVIKFQSSRKLLLIGFARSQFS